MKVGSLFSGIGGLELGLERAGMEVVWQVEIDDFCNRVLEKHWPDVKRYRDVREVGKHNLEPVDLICGGFPCQPVSQAGEKRAQEDDRWLWPEFARIVRELGPNFVLVENVPGLLARGMGDVLRDLAALRYDAGWESIPASAVGAPHRRDRVWILAHTEIITERTRLCAGGPTWEWGRRFSHGGGKKVLANPTGERLEGWDNGSKGVHPGCVRLLPSRPGERLRDPWAIEPNVGRVAYGIPNRVDRLRALGNAVVPQVAEWIGHQILAAELIASTT